MAEKKNPEYDFKWCPGCGDFGVKKALEAAIKKKTIETEIQALKKLYSSFNNQNNFSKAVNFISKIKGKCFLQI